MTEKTVSKKKKTPAGGGGAQKLSAKNKTGAATKKTFSRKAKTEKSKKTKSVSSSKYGKRFLNEMTKELLSMRESILKDVSRSMENQTEQIDLDVGDFYDKASSDRDRILSLTFSERERKKLGQIEEALRRIREGTYGICEMTGEKIGEDRLRVMPLARFNIEAQEEMEKAG